MVWALRNIHRVLNKPYHKFSMFVLRYETGSVNCHKYCGPIGKIGRQCHASVAGINGIHAGASSSIYKITVLIHMLLHSWCFCAHLLLSLVMIASRLTLWLLKRLEQIQKLGRYKHRRLSIKADTLTYTWPKLYQIHSTIKNKSICRRGILCRSITA